MKRAEIVSIGDELLRGVVQDTNTHWIAQSVTARGASVDRAALLPDRPDVAGAAIREAIARGPDLVVTQGGLGPTDDDRTREALAAATGAPLERHDAAAEIVVRRFRELAAAGAVADDRPTPARMRMAMLPRGAAALDNQVGTAPGIVLAAGSTTIVALPGVPPELKWIWQNPLAPILDRVLGPGAFVERTMLLDLLDESRIAHVLRLTQERHPRVYVKSRARGYDAGQEVRLTITASAASRAEAADLLESAMADALAALAAEGVGARAED